MLTLAFSVTPKFYPQRTFQALTPSRRSTVVGYFEFFWASGPGKLLPYWSHAEAIEQREKTVSDLVALLEASEAGLERAP
jgi:hypothetical protein